MGGRNCLAKTLKSMNSAVFRPIRSSMEVESSVANVWRKGSIFGLCPRLCRGATNFVVSRYKTETCGRFRKTPRLSCRLDQLRRPVRRTVGPGVFLGLERLVCVVGNVCRQNASAVPQKV